MLERILPRFIKLQLPELDILPGRNIAVVVKSQYILEH